MNPFFYHFAIGLKNRLTCLDSNYKVFVKTVNELNDPVIIKIAQLVTVGDEDGNFFNACPEEDVENVKYLLVTHFKELGIEDYKIGEVLGIGSLGTVLSVEVEGKSLAFKGYTTNRKFTFQKSLSALKKLANVAQSLGLFSLKNTFDCFFKQFSTELDYLSECKKQEVFRDLFDSKLVQIPRSFPALSRENILCSERVEGTSLYSYCKGASQSQKNQLGLKLFEFNMNALFVQHHQFSDPNPGNFMVNKEGELVVLDFGLTRRFSEEEVDNLSGMIVAGTLRRRDLFENYKHVFETNPENFENLWNFMLVMTENCETESYRYSPEHLTHLKLAAKNLSREFEDYMLCTSRWATAFTAILGTLGATGNFQEVMMKTIDFNTYSGKPIN